MRLIDSDALIERLEPYKDKYGAEEFPYYMVHEAFIYEMEKEPTVDAVPVRHGKWIYGNEFHWYTASCNQCGYKRYTDIKATNWNGWKYCPNCGARMDEECGQRSAD